MNCKPGPIVAYPAGHPAAVMIAALAPRSLAGWTRPLAAGAADLLPAGLARLPLLSPGTDGMDDLSTRGAALLVDVGRRGGERLAGLERLARSGPCRVLQLDGRLAQLPDSLSILGDALAVSERGRLLADLAATVLASSRGRFAGRGDRILLACGPDGREVPAAGSAALELFAHLGLTLMTAPGRRAVVPVQDGAVRAFAPDWIIALDSAALAPILQRETWADLPALRLGRVRACPALPFPWLDRPPGINRLAGLLWLKGLLAGEEGQGLADARLLLGRLFPVSG